MIISKNFLTKDEFNSVEEAIMGDRFPWYYNDEVVNPGDGFFQFTYLFVNNGKENCNSKTMDMLKPILNKIKYKKIRRIKANLLTKSENIIEHGLHTDVDEKMKTGIFYVNTCNGYTKFKGGKKIKSEKNKYVEFDSDLMHTGSTCTDKKRRVVINFNYT
tara:strand:- start:212 stop:691 length:480 start_codon:yes stop_codon:yes gene_type:complete